jgi:hypothetical protein
MTRSAHLLTACALLALAACSPALKLIGGLAGHSGVSANVQAGAVNSQTLGTTDASSQAVSRSTVGTVHQSRDVSQVQAQNVGKVTVNQVSPWMIIALISALFLDSPMRWPGEIATMFKRKPVAK